MKHASTRAVFAYWNERRGTRAAPERADIDPGEIRRELGDTIMLAADFVEQWRFRLAGTRVCALFGREIKGEALTALWRDEDHKTLDDLSAAISEEKIGAVMGLTGLADDGAAVDLELLLLPLAHTGHARIRALGVLVPLAPPFWLGSKPVTQLQLTALRHIGPDIDSFGPGPTWGHTSAPTLAPAQSPLSQSPLSQSPLHDGGRIKHGFVVYSGGREPPDEKAS